MKTVHEVSALAGVSVRTLHHYDAIGLLKPSAVTQAGYRLYDEAALRRLQNILLLRELEFPLQQIRTILEDPDFDEKTALEQQIRLFELQKERLDGLIALARERIQGGTEMKFEAFDKSRQQQYAQEAAKRWGKTEAWREAEKKQADRTEAEENALAGGLMELFRQFGQLKEQKPDAEAPQKQAAALQQYISDHYYPCTMQILQSLGVMYEEDPRFRENIDRAGGDGTAAFVRQVLERYCK